MYQFQFHWQSLLQSYSTMSFILTLLFRHSHQLGNNAGGKYDRICNQISSVVNNQCQEGVLHFILLLVNMHGSDLGGSKSKRQ